MIQVVHKLDPAYMVIEKLGGKAAVAAATKLDKSTLSRWCAPPPVGTGGVIPQRHWPALLRLAKRQGQELTLRELANLRA
jgi:hypothetical protein